MERFVAAYLQFVSASNSSSCSKHGDCNECVGAFATSTSCLWCAETDECISKSNADYYCTPSKQDDTCDTPYYTIIFILVLGILVCICLVSCFFREWNRNRRDQDGLRQPLLGRNRHEVLRSSTVDNDWMCVICGFDNPKSNSNCTMCGTTETFSTQYVTDKIKEKEKRRAQRRKRSIKIPDEAQIDGSVSITTRSSLTNIERQAAFNYRRLNQLSIRQKSARRRRMWQRVVDEESGDLIWARTAFDETMKKSGDLDQSSSVLSSMMSPRQSFDSKGDTNALLAAAGRPPAPRTPQKDSFDATLTSTSPGYVSHFNEDGSLHWEKVESGRPTRSSNPSAPHYSGAVANPSVLEFTG